MMKAHIYFLLVFSIVLLSRLPFLNAGYGTDSDAWRVAYSSRIISSTGDYRASRLPGYPVQEYTYSLIASSSPMMFNFCTALFSAIAAGLFSLILIRLGSRNILLTSLAFAFTPIVYINSTSSMDYLWAMTFVLGSFYAAIVCRPMFAGFLLGIGTGCRITSLMFGLPVAFLLFYSISEDKRLKSIVSYAGATILTGAIAYSPVFAKYGIGFFTFYEHGYPSLLAILRSMTVDVWGYFGFLAFTITLAATIIRNRKHFFRESLPESGPKMIVFACVAASALSVLMFLRLPVEPAYLIPVVPFVLLISGYYMNRRYFVILCCAVIFSSFSGIIDSSDRPWSPSPSTAALSISVQRRNIVFEFIKGPVFNDYERRVKRLQFVDRLLAFGDILEKRSAIVAGVWLPQVTIAGRCPLPENEEVEYVSVRGNAEYHGLVDKATVDDLHRQNIPIYYIISQDKYNLEITGVDLKAIGAIEFK